MIIEFTVPAIPVAQPRQRHRIATGGAGHSFVQNYTPKSDPVNSFKASVRLHARQQYQGAPIEGPIRINIVAVFPRPASMIKKTKPNPRVWKSTKPDNDNLEKSVWDSLSGLLWRDDSQIADSRMRKYVADANEQPCVFVTVETL